MGEVVWKESEDWFFKVQAKVRLYAVLRESLVKGQELYPCNAVIIMFNFYLLSAAGTCTE